MNNARVYSYIDLTRAAFAQFPGNGGPILMNNYYCAATRDWVNAQFSGYLWNFEIAQGQITYKTRGNQCEHFALRAALEVVDLFRQMADDAVPAAAESIAVACCKYQKGAGTATAVWHEVNLWFLDGAWCAWEPQTRTFFDFTDAERLTVQQLLIP